MRGMLDRYFSMGNVGYEAYLRFVGALAVLFCIKGMRGMLGILVPPGVEQFYMYWGILSMQGMYVLRVLCWV